MVCQKISYDGSFQLVRKNKAYDSHDLCLSDGAKYWVEQSQYKAHLEANNDTAYQQSTQGLECNNHRAANDTWVRHTGIAESGVGTVTCARHTLYMPSGVVNYFKGERFAYTDFAILSVLQLLFLEGAITVGIFYDIYCHWIKTFWARMSHILLPQVPIDPSKVFGGVGKYHITGHTDSCYAQYSPNNMQGVGRLDAEGCERAWADLNQAARSSSEKGPGFRIDSLNHCMQDWNWRKITGMVSLLLTKYTEAVVMAAEQESQWREFHDSLDNALTSKWADMPITPYKDKGGKTWTSVFLSKQAAATSITRKLLELNKLEQKELQQQNSEPGITLAAWIAEGLEIESQQQQLVRDLKACGSNMTDRQALDFFNHRSALSSRIIRNRQSAAFFLDIILSVSHNSESLAEETDGQPEKATLYLPSQLGKSLSLTERSIRAKGTEYKIRRVACLRGIHRLKVAAIQKKNAIMGKQQRARGEIHNTRAQGVIDRIAQRVDLACWEYTNSWRAMKVLGVDDMDAKLFRPIEKADISKLSRFLGGNRELGEGYKEAPWFWSVPVGDSEAEPMSVEQEVNEANRVEWFRGRERYKRWQEEESLLRREIASVILDFNSRADDWRNKLDTDHTKMNSGYAAYCVRQRDSWLAMRDDAIQRAQTMLNAQPEIAICQRVKNMYS
ncbi:hypothetical protein FRC08_000988 [Ceratobasidium sp. 394]|nr:hypothetical protein FRC08_000988 [Ceratobasidium sp. 394]